MKNIRVAAAAINTTPLDIKGNVDKIKRVIYEAAEKEVNILCLPELCITGYNCEDAFFSEELVKRALKSCSDIRKFIEEIDSNIIVSVGLPFIKNNCIYNVASLISKYEVYGFVPKKYLANDGIHYEGRWFKPWDGGYEVRDHYECFGNVIFNLNGINVGFEICEDAFTYHRRGIDLAQNCVDIILNPSASHFSFGKHNTRKNIVLEGSRAFKCTYVYANLLGNEAGRAIYSGDTIIAQNGNLIANGPILSFGDYILTTAIVDVTLPRVQQRENGSFKVDNTYHQQKTCLVKFDEVNKSKEDNIIHPSPGNKFEEFTNAEILGLYDYMRKSNSKGYTISLSGGADSAACACLVDLMCQETKLNVKEVLTTIYQATSNSSNVTKNAAKKLADSIGNTHYEIDVDEIKDSYTYKIERLINRELNWKQDDITLQNIQARVRCPSIFMLSNINNSLVLCTSNRSESAVGFSTAFGDLAGSLAPIAGIDKPFILQWLNYIYKEYNYTGLKDVIKQQPTAELRPIEQTDEKDLMPYKILDVIEKASMRDKKFPVEVLLTIIPEFPQYTKDQLKEWTKKFFRLFVRNQWKREITPVSFFLDDEALDPKSWLRWPVLCSNLEEYLSELDEI